MIKLSPATEKLFWSKVNKTTTCWLWTKGTQDGYGIFWVPSLGNNRRAHVVAYNLIIGAVPDGLELDHRCRVRNCVRPDHLEPVTTQVNLLRGKTLAAVNSVKTKCPYGHPYNDGNVYMGSKGERICRTCELKRQKRTYTCEYCGVVLQRRGRLRHLRRKHAKVLA